MPLIISGPTGVGKDSIWIPAAERLGFARHLMYTTRPARTDESDGLDYHFITKTQFRQFLLNGEFVAWEYYFSNYYGMPPFPSTDVVTQAITKLAVRVKEKNKNTIIVSLQPGSADNLYNRLKANRGYDSDELVLRMHHVQEEIENSFLADVVVERAENFTLGEAVDRLTEILRQHPALLPTHMNA